MQDQLAQRLVWMPHMTGFKKQPDVIQVFRAQMSAFWMKSLVLTLGNSKEEKPQL